MSLAVLRRATGCLADFMSGPPGARRSGTAQRLEDLVGALLVLLVGIILGAFRLPLVRWKELSFNPWTVMALILWALGGLIPAFAAPLTALTPWKRSRSVEQARNGRCATNLLPMTTVEVHCARSAGRLAGFLLHVVGGMVVLWLAREAMVSGGLVQTPPPLLDPWVIGAFATHVTFQVLSVRVMETARWWDQTLSNYRAIFYTAIGGLAFLVALVNLPEPETHHWPPPQWPLLHALLIGCGVLVLMALVEGLPAVRRFEMSLCCAAPRGDESGEALEDEPEAQAGILLPVSSLGLPGLAGIGRYRRWLPGLARSALTVAAIAAGASVLLQLAGRVYVMVCGQDLSGGTAPPSDVSAGIMIPFALFVFLSAIIAPGMAWPEVVAPRRHGNVLILADTGGARAHAGLLAPRDLTHLWWQRLGALVTWLVVISAACPVGLLVPVLTLSILNAEPRPGLVQHTTAIWTVLGVSGAVAAVYFALLPMVHRARKVLFVPGRAVWPAVVVLAFGAFVGVIALALRGGDEAWPSAWPWALFPALGYILLTLLISAATWPPDAWPVSKNGGPTILARAMALGVYVWACLEGVLAGALLGWAF